ncbi:MAG: toll/interleukin-1 receptor domain-containing protein [Desulfobacteraceae bacterium]|nr:toll/interleukin-1 receptor domain-containing protein [Desulfobacteraceae bacterium]
MRVFISHSSKDKPAVEPLVHALRERGFDPNGLARLNGAVHRERCVRPGHPGLL